MSISFVAAALLLAGQSLAQHDGGDKPSAAATRSVVVNGAGRIMTVPDQLRVSVQVASRAETAAEAMSTASRKTAEVLAILKEYGVETRDVQTSRVTVSAILDFQRNIQPPPVIGYSGINEFSVLFKGKLMDRVGEFLDRAVTAGVSSFSGLMYESSKQRELEREALVKAAADAQARAAVLARELGASLGRVMTISEAVNVPSPMLRSAMTDAMSAAAPVMTGEVAISAQVTVTFELK